MGEEKGKIKEIYCVAVKHSHVHPVYRSLCSTGASSVACMHDVFKTGRLKTIAPAAA